MREALAVRSKLPKLARARKRSRRSSLSVWRSSNLLVLRSNTSGACIIRYRHLSDRRYTGSLRMRSVLYLPQSLQPSATGTGQTSDLSRSATSTGSLRLVTALPKLTIFREKNREQAVAIGNSSLHHFSALQVSLHCVGTCLVPTSFHRVRCHTLQSGKLGQSPRATAPCP